MKAKLNLIGTIFLSILITSCNSPENKDTTSDEASVDYSIGKPDNFDYGHVEDGIYVNAFFELELTIPDNWVVQSQEQTENLMKMGGNMVAGDDKNLEALIKASEITTATLLSVFQYEVGSPVDYNPGFILIAENISYAPGISTGSDYLTQAKKIMGQSQMQFDYIDDDFAKEIINGQEFYTMNCTMNYLGVNINQRYYSTIIDGFSLSAVISFTNKKQEKELTKMMNSLYMNK